MSCQTTFEAIFFSHEPPPPPKPDKTITVPKSAISNPYKKKKNTMLSLFHGKVNHENIPSNVAIVAPEFSLYLYTEAGFHSTVYFPDTFSALIH